MQPSSASYPRASYRGASIWIGVLALASTMLSCESLRPLDTGSAGPSTVHLTERLADARIDTPDDSEGSVSVEMVAKERIHRRSLKAPLPSRIEFDVRVPNGGRIDLFVGIAGTSDPVRFGISVKEGDEKRVDLIDQTINEPGRWLPVSAELERWTSERISLGLSASSETRAGGTVLWGTPLLSGEARVSRPNVIFYVIDAAGAEYMSVYGYNRRTTPNLERIARKGVVFEHAYSNSTWTKISTPSFLTSLHHGVLGGYTDRTDRLPQEAVPIAEHLRENGYQTGLFTSNSFAGRMTGLERGIDVLREAGVEPNSRSSVQLHEDFWTWREQSPGQPYWAHFQTTDVHWPWKPVAPFAGLFVSPTRRAEFYGWETELADATGLDRPQWLHAWRYPPRAFETTGIDKDAFFRAGRGLYDETMAHNDAQLGRLVERLKTEGEWQNTLLIIASDHGNAHGLGFFDPIPPRPEVPLFSAFRTRVPLIFVWPERIAPGRRIGHPVSMIDLLPTVLDLLDLPEPDVAQGQSLAPLLLGRGTPDLSPVIIEEVYVDSEEGSRDGWIEMIDGRWGASIRFTQLDGELRPQAEADVEGVRLYDLGRDPHALQRVENEHPELARRFAERLGKRWNLHQALSRRFQNGGQASIDPEQLETLRSLGYNQ